MRRFVFLLLVMVLLAFTYQRWRDGRLSWGRRTPEKYTPAEGPVIDLKDVQVLAALDSEYTRLVDAVVPSVVSITTSKRVRIPRAIDPLEYFFGGPRRVVERTQSGLGSGVIVSKEGHILTNHHVVAGMEEIRVQLTDGRIEPAQLIGSDQKVDIAVLRVRAGNLQPLPLGDSDSVQVGQMVFAVGNPFGLQETVTQGIVSAKGRAIRDTSVELLQTDAAVNPGNSGGPLLNLRGEIIGINSAIYSQTGGWAGISFAIPSNVARSSLESIAQSGRVIRGYLGVTMMELNPALAREFGLPDTRGALVADVVPESPAEMAGLKSGDIIRSINGRDVANTRELRSRVAEAGVGRTVELGVFRDGRGITIHASIAEMPDDLSGARIPRAPEPAAPDQPEPPATQEDLEAPELTPRQSQIEPAPDVSPRPPVIPTLPTPRPASPPPRAEVSQKPATPTQPAPPARVAAPSRNNVLAGMAVDAIPTRVREVLPPSVRGGVIITQLQPNSPAAERLRVGDVIEELNQTPVRSVAEFEKIAASIPQGSRALLFVCRGRTRSFVVVTP